jgi:Bacterial regulatory proteins, gntR family
LFFLDGEHVHSPRECLARRPVAVAFLPQALDLGFQGSDLLAQLRSGRPVPSERTLTQRYGVVVGTVKKAVEVLRAEGRVHTVIGRGIFVR